MVEIWADIEGWEGLYRVSNMGHVYSMPRKIIRRNGSPHTIHGCMLKSIINKTTGHAIVFLKNCGEQETHTIGNLVANAFVPNPNNYTMIYHIDGDILHNQDTNLSWCSHDENKFHRLISRRNSVPKPVRCVETNKIYASSGQVDYAYGWCASSTRSAIKRGGRCHGLTFKYV